MVRRARPRVHGRVHSCFAFVLLLPMLLCGAAPQPPDPCDSVPSPPQWTTVNLDYSGQRFVDLDRIKPENVGQLTKICELQLNSASWFSSGLLMVDGTIYVNTVHSTYALDAATCVQRWRYDIPFTSFIATISNRGSAYADGMLFRGTADGRVIALAAKTSNKNGQLIWQTQAADPSRHESFTAAPVAFNDKVFIGIVTADLGVRGRVMAFDTKKGHEIWRFNTIPLGTEPGAETWAPATYGGAPPAGGAYWTSFSIDPQTGELFGPASNPNPDYVRLPLGFDKAFANLYTNSVISLDVATGKLKWFTQTIAGDDHDWDLGTQPSLYLSKNGKRKMLAVTGKEGFVIAIDRDSPSIDTPDGPRKNIAFKTAGTTQSSTLLHSGTGSKDSFPPPNDGYLRLVCPGTIGGAEWNGTAYHPCTGTLFSGMVDSCFYYSTSYWGGDPGGFWAGQGGGIVRAEFSKLPSGHITAMDGEKGTVLWRYPVLDPANPPDPKKAPVLAPVLAGLVPTKSGLLFAGDVRGNLLALDAKSGTLLKQIDVGGALNHGLISYEVKDRQYVAAAVGGLTLNAVGVSGPLRVSIYGLPQGGKPPDVQVSKPRVPIPWTAIPPNPPPAQKALFEAVKSAESFVMICSTCHGQGGVGGEAPPMLRHTELANDDNNFEMLKKFLAGVPPPMPILYPGLLDDDEVEAIGAFLKYSVFSPKTNGQLANSAPLGYIYKQPKSAGTPEWQKIYSVLTFPRCINCHTTTTYPRQRDYRYPHIYAITRGTDDRGALVARCESCHGTKNDELGKGIPGAADWHIAPLSMAWESAPGIPMTGPELCTMLKDPLRNGNRTLQELLNHLKTPLVEWAWTPGKRWNDEQRATPPGTHDEFVNTMTAWINGGAKCPEE